MSLQMTSYFVFIVETCREIYTMYIDKNAVIMFEHILNNTFNYICGVSIVSCLYSIIILILNHICQTVYYKVCIIK